MSGRHRQRFSANRAASNLATVTHLRAARSAANECTENQISIVEAVAYTLLIAFFAMVALGWFDLMIPWQD